MDLNNGPIKLLVNVGKSAIYYLAKYLTKTDNDVDAQLYACKFYKKNEETQKEHFQGRIVGSLEACFDVCGWDKHRSSRDVIYINTNMPHDDKRSCARILKVCQQIVRIFL